MYELRSVKILWVLFTIFVLPSNGLTLEELALYSLFGCSGQCCAPPINFPENIEIRQEDYSNWAGTIKSNSIWVAIPETSSEVVQIVNWAHENDYTVRPVGFGLGWSPLAVSPGSNCEKVIAVRTVEKLNRMKLMPGLPTTVKVQTGASMDNLTNFLANQSLALSSRYPVSGQISVGGIISGGGHGAGIAPAAGNVIPGFTFGSMSNVVISLTAVVWDSLEASYVLKTFNRNDSETKDMIVNLGRAFLVDVTLLIGPDYNLECRSSVDIPIGELYMNPNEVRQGADRTFASLVSSSGSVSSIWFAFTLNPWIRTWTVEPTQTRFSKHITQPYAYPFSDMVGEGPSTLVRSILNGAPWLAPALGNAESFGVTAGLLATRTFYVWGTSANTLLYVKPSTLRITTNGYAIHTKRENVQLVVSAFTKEFFRLIEVYKSQGKYPINIGHELRVTGPDYAENLGVYGAEPPSLSPSTPFVNNPEFDTVIWADTISLPNTPEFPAFGKDLEKFLFNEFTPDIAIVRPEWAKGFAFTEQSSWSNLDVLQNKIPSLYTNWDSARATLTKYDPGRVFSNALLDVLLLN